MPYRAEAARILALWRDVERQLEGTPAEAEEHAALVDEWARLQLEYQRLTELALMQHRPSPDPWPEREGPAMLEDSRARG